MGFVLFGSSLVIEIRSPVVPLLIGANWTITILLQLGGTVSAPPLLIIEKGGSCFGAPTLGSEISRCVFRGHAAATLAKFKVPESEQRDAVAFVQSLRKDIVE